MIVQVFVKIKTCQVYTWIIRKFVTILIQCAINVIYIRAGHAGGRFIHLGRGIFRSFFSKNLDFSFTEIRCFYKIIR